MGAGIKLGLLPVRGPVLHLVRGVLGGCQAEDLGGEVVTVHHLSEAQIDHTVDVVVLEEVLLVALADVTAARAPRSLGVEDTGLADVPRVIHEVGGGVPAPLHASGQAVLDRILGPGAHTRAGRILTPALGQGHEHHVRVVALTRPLAAVPSAARAAVPSRAAFPPRPPETIVLAVLIELAIAATISGIASRVATALKKPNQSHSATTVLTLRCNLFLSNKNLPKAPVFGPFSSYHQNRLGQTAC